MIPLSQCLLHCRLSQANVRSQPSQSRPLLPPPPSTKYTYKGVITAGYLPPTLPTRRIRALSDVQGSWPLPPLPFGPSSFLPKPASVVHSFLPHLASPHTNPSFARDHDQQTIDDEAAAARSHASSRRGSRLETFANLSSSFSTFVILFFSVASTDSPRFTPWHSQPRHDS